MRRWIMFMHMNKTNSVTCPGFKKTNKVNMYDMMIYIYIYVWYKIVVYIWYGMKWYVFGLGIILYHE